MIKKAVIPAAGLGTRLLTATKEQPKEMLPLFSTSSNGDLCLKPIVQLIFEQLCSYGVKEFCFIVGRGKRMIEDHFTPDYAFLDQLKALGKTNAAESLHRFYSMIEHSTIFWLNQPEPRGFGHAVSLSESFANHEPFLVHAGDSLIISNGSKHLDRLTKSFDENASSTMFTKVVEDPRQYGVVIGDPDVNEKLIVKRLFEKPEHPESNIAIMPVYIFDGSIFHALRNTKPSKGEMQLTDAIQRLVGEGKRVHALQLLENEVCLDIGTPVMYQHALETSYKYCLNHMGHSSL